MAYISQDTKKELAPAIKAVLKKYNMKGTIGIDRHTSLRVRVKEGPLKFDDYEQVNHYHIEKFYGEGTKETAFLTELLMAMKGTKWYDKSDYQTDYFDTAYWIDIHVGQWNKAYVQTTQRGYIMSNMHNEMMKETILDEVLTMTVQDLQNAMIHRKIEGITVIDEIVENMVEKIFEEMCEQEI